MMSFANCSFARELSEPIGTLTKPNFGVSPLAILNF